MSVEAKLDMNEDDYVDSFRPQMMDVVHAWCNGATFAQICKMTDVFEGKLHAVINVITIKSCWSDAIIKLFFRVSELYVRLAHLTIVIIHSKLVS